ncbi:Hsp70 family protein [Marinagarivorans algicola]|uniref:Hsp70 family protein n=1 Tax=Marinagarivorans algicola TaxID=1513270 RepID=UPI0006B41B25|nr:Hsp70 family protein [Marinagarivorans algicola]
MSEQKQFFVGIDLGTTNTVVAYAALSDKHNVQARKIFAIEQLVAPGEVAKRPMLPSFRYHPAAGEIAAADCLLPWSHSTELSHYEAVEGDIRGVIVGEWARELGAKTTGRQVHSAKSWLSHSQVDRQANILPWGAEDVKQVSPVVASASYLNHVRQAWNFEHPNAPLEAQELVITVPASFDADARALTLEAAALAGLKAVRLLEEPQAVCYHWYANNKASVGELLNAKKLLMVCDVGGGTTDLSLISISQNAQGEIDLARVGVGEHLMLGGDNLDLALAHIVERRLNLPKALTAGQLSQVIAQTRSAKERLLDNPKLTAATVTLMGGGSQLISAAKRCEISREEITHLALEGFFPLVDLDCTPHKRRSAVMEFGLPYAADPTITKHFAHFVYQHQDTCRKANAVLANDQPAVPDCLLLNGGVFNSQAIRLRTLEQLAQWRGDDITQLDNSEPHLAVAYGAVSYLMARAGGQKTIKGGSARAFFLVLEQVDQPAKGVCLLPKGSAEGVEYLLAKQRFNLRLDQPVNFTIASTRLEKPFELGAVVELTDDFFVLPPLVTQIDACEVSDRQSIVTEKGSKYLPVMLKAQLTELGVLQLECLAYASVDTLNSADTVGLNTHNAPSWALEFQARAQRSSSFKRVHLPHNFALACQAIEQVFGDKNAKILASHNVTPKLLRKHLEQLLGKRESWDAQCLRALFDLLIEHKDKRRRSVAHERLWFNLAGFCVRPGCGDAADIWRIEKIWPLYEAFLSFEKETQSWIDFWTFWRRAAGGLSAQQQIHIFEGLAPYTDPQYIDSRKVNAEAKLISYDDVLRLLASLERVPTTYKIQLVDNLLTRLTLKNPSAISYWAIGRIAARIPFYSGYDCVVPAKNVEKWLEALWPLDWAAADKALAFCITLMTRMSGDRARDINDVWRQKIITRLEQAKAPAIWLNMVASHVVLEAAQNEQILGESLPAGLSFLDDSDRT